MKIHQYLNTKEEDITCKKHNIFIPICLGNKFFSSKGVLSKNIEECLEWALSNTKEKVLFIIVDKIQNTNFYVRNNNKSEKSSLEHVLKEGDVLEKAIDDLISRLPNDKKEKVNVIKWMDYANSDPLCDEITQIVYKEFETNNEFKNLVLNSVKTSVVDREFSEDDYLRLCNYVLDEFCIVYSGIEYKATYFGLYLYPDTDSVLYFIEDIKAGNIFVELHNRLPIPKTGVLILN